MPRGIPQQQGTFAPQMSNQMSQLPANQVKVQQQSVSQQPPFVPKPRQQVPPHRMPNTMIMSQQFTMNPTMSDKNQMPSPVVKSVPNLSATVGPSQQPQVTGVKGPESYYPQQPSSGLENKLPENVSVSVPVVESEPSVIQHGETLVHQQSESVSTDQSSVNTSSSSSQPEICAEQLPEPVSAETHLEVLQTKQAESSTMLEPEMSQDVTPAEVDVTDGQVTLDSEKNVESNIETEDSVAELSNENEPSVSHSEETPSLPESQDRNIDEISDNPSSVVQSESMQEEIEGLFSFPHKLLNKHVAIFFSVS